MGEHATRASKQQSRVSIERGKFEVEDALLLQAYCNSWQIMLALDLFVLEKHGEWCWNI